MKHLAFLLILFISSSCTSQEQTAPTVLRVNQAEWTKFISQVDSPQLVDVRTEDEFAQGHLEGALNIDFYSDDFVSEMEKNLDKNSPLFIYCRSGGRSAKASAQLQEAGFHEIYDLSVGYSGWEK